MLSTDSTASYLLHHHVILRILGTASAAVWGSKHLMTEYYHCLRDFTADSTSWAS